MVLEVGAAPSQARPQRALRHDDIYGALDTGWIMLFGKDAQQTADQASSCAASPSFRSLRHEHHGRLSHHHLERTFYKHESGLIREYSARPRHHRLPHRGPAHSLRTTRRRSPR